MAKPNCFDTDVQWDEWRAAHNTLIGGKSSEQSYCLDCTAEHQREMKLQERCEYPVATAFMPDRDHDGGWQPLAFKGVRRRD